MNWKCIEHSPFILMAMRRSDSEDVLKVCVYVCMYVEMGLFCLMCVCGCVCAVRACKCVCVIRACPCRMHVCLLVFECVCMSVLACFESLFLYVCTL